MGMNLIHDKAIVKSLYAKVFTGNFNELKACRKIFNSFVPKTIEQSSSLGIETVFFSANLDLDGTSLQISFSLNFVLE